MKLLIADTILTCNHAFEIITDGAVAYDERIIDVGKSEVLKLKYPDATHIIAPPNSVILPGLINAHVHLEFSANQCLLSYGDFIPWLQSVIKHREALNEMATTPLIEAQLHTMLLCGTTSLGAISSFGSDLEACVQTPQRVVYFNEILGSIPSAVDAMYADFLSRYHNSMDEKSSTFVPAVAIHSAYSTHPILAKKAIEMAFKEQTPLSTHFMESQAEREWVDEGRGDFETFFSTFNPHAKPLCDAKAYLKLFTPLPALFTHCVHASQEERAMIKQSGGVITHCPRSNRLLGTGKLDLGAVIEENIPFTLATDGLSSNSSLSLWDEMRSCLMMHTQLDLNPLAQALLQSVTSHAAKALNLPCGVIEKEAYADLIVLTLPQAPTDEKEIALHLILHTQQTHWSIINGEIQC